MTLQPMLLNRFGSLLTLLGCADFALRALDPIEATGFWGDELYMVVKSFQPSVWVMWAMLRQDIYSPVY